MPVVLTGASGVVGGAVARHLVAAGREVAGVARSGTAATTLSALGVAPRSGDILDRGSLEAAFADAEVVYHVAGVNEFCLRDPAPMYQANVDGTRNVMRAARATGVQRVVYTSSAIVLGEQRGTVGNERSPHRGTFLSHYERSKFEAERVAFDEADGLELVVVSPSSVQGPGRATGTGRLILDVINGELPALVDSTLSVVDIDDCARGHLLAEAEGAAGERYVLNGFCLGVRDAIAMLERLIDVEIAVRYLPRALARAAIPVVDAVNRVRSLPICGEMIRAMLHGHAYDGSKATRDLGLAYAPAEATLRRTIDWFRSEGLISR